jgi:protein involved in polysaccharide export with SLBB domain
MNSLLNKLLATVLLLCCARTLAADGIPGPNPLPQVVVIGDGVRVQGAIPYAADLTVMSVIMLSGGITEFGGSRVYLIREAKSTKLDLREIEKNPKKDVLLKPWDIVYIRS